MACSAAFSKYIASSTAHSRMIFQAHCPVSTIQAYAGNIRQSSLSKTPVLFADHPSHERASVDGVVVRRRPPDTCIKLINLDTLVLELISQLDCFFSITGRS